jgi:hypothetical protein
MTNEDNQRNSLLTAGAANTDLERKIGTHIYPTPEEKNVEASGSIDGGSTDDRDLEELHSLGADTVAISPFEDHNGEKNIQANRNHLDGHDQHGQSTQPTPEHTRNGDTRVLPSSWQTTKTCILLLAYFASIFAFALFGLGLLFLVAVIAVIKLAVYSPALLAFYIACYCLLLVLTFTEKSWPKTESTLLDLNLWAYLALIMGAVILLFIFQLFCLLRILPHYLG